MKTTIARSAVLAALLAAGAAHAQGFETYRPRETLNFFNYLISIPVGNFNDKFIKDTSFRGFGFDARSLLREQFSVGVGIDFTRFQQTFPNLTQETAIGGGLISGPVYRYADQFDIKALFHGYLRQGPILPYAGVGIGGVWTYAYQQSADLANAHNNFSFILTPEIGATFTAAKGASSLGLNLALRYNYTTSDFFKVSDASNFQIVIGIFAGY
jgi:hypothetical protein